MRIALVTQHYPPHFEGGTEIVVRAQAREMRARGHEVRVVAGSDRPHDGADVERHEVDGIQVALLPRKPGEPYDLLLERPRLLELVEREVAGAELAHVHHWSTLDARLVSRLVARMPVVVTLHDFFTTCARFFRVPPRSDVSCPPRGDFEPCVRCLEPDAGGLGSSEISRQLEGRARRVTAELRHASKLIAPSAFLARRLEPLLDLPDGLIRVLSHGLPRAMERTAAPFPGRFVHRRRPLRVLHFGHRSTLKGTLDLVRALASLPAGSAELRLAGMEVEAGFDAQLRAAAGALELRWHAAYGPAELREFASGGDLAAFPSRAHESYGLVVDEALALGLPVWVSDRGALSERLNAAGRRLRHLPGRVLPAENPDAWSEAFAGVLRDSSELLRERERVPAHVRSAAHAALDLEVLYREVLSP